MFCSLCAPFCVSHRPALRSTAQQHSCHRWRGGEGGRFSLRVAPASAATGYGRPGTQATGIHQREIRCDPPLVAWYSVATFVDVQQLPPEGNCLRDWAHSLTVKIRPKIHMSTPWVHTFRTRGSLLYYMRRTCSWGTPWHLPRRAMTGVVACTTVHIYLVACHGTPRRATACVVERRGTPWRAAATSQKKVAKND